MPKKEVFNLTIDVGANISQAQTAAKSLQQAFSKINLSDNLRGNLDKTFANLEKELNSLSALTSKPFTSMKDIQKAEKSYDKINDLMGELVAQSKSIEGADLSKFIPADALNKLKSFNTQLEQVRKNAQALESQKISIGKDLENARKKGNDLKDEIDQVTAKLQQAESSSDKSKSMQNRIEGYKVTLAGLNVELTQNTQKQKELNDELKKLENVKPEGLQQLRESLKEFTGDSLRQIPRTFESLQNYINNLQADEIEKIRKNVKNLSPEAQRLAEAFGIVPQRIRETADEGQRLSETAAEVERLSNQVKQFFSIGNAIQLFKRTIRDAMNTVKELDKAMTETATVTDFSISDMWEQLPRYTEEANKLGTSINSLYKATTLYYQQGLDTNEAMALGIETIKMARVAGMDAAQATDLMTAALRGFNMELNETSAVRVNDVYSELAAVTAADTDEIGIAISKTASIAHSANMEFETTAAFLSQIIETTREAPETAGTAMKTIVARFSEVKKLYSEGQITGTDEEGEVVNVNKIQEALRTVGIDMSKFFTGKEGLDQVLLRLAEKWDTLDVVTQRYIATQAAGSRQQSRFLAMMSDYDRTLELVNAAYDSAGSGQRQFEKTLDSMEAKLAELKNAWDQFVMGIANSDLLKGFIDTLTSILGTINKLLNAISGGNGLIKTIASLGASFLALRTGAKIFGSSSGKGGFIGKFLNALKGNDVQNQAKKTGVEIGASIGENIGEGISSTKEKIKNKFSSFFSKENFGLGSTVSFTKDYVPKDFAEATMKLSKEQRLEVKTILKTEGLEAAIKKIKEFGQEVDHTEIKTMDWNKAATAVGQTLMGVGTVVTVLGGIVSKSNKEAGEVITTIGSIITGLGGIISIIPGVVSGIKAISSALSVSSGVVGVAITVIGALIGAFVALANNTPEKKLERAQKKAEESAKAAQEAQQAYDDLLSNRNSYTELEEKVASLTKGTQEWTEAVRELNAKVLELVQNYESLEIEYDSQGNLSISKESWDKVEQQQKTKTDKATATALSDRINAAQTKVDVAKNNASAVGSNGQVYEDWELRSLRNSMGQISDEDWEDYLKSQEIKIVPTVDLSEANKELEIARKNMILAFMPESVDKKEANQVGKALTNLIGDALDEESDPKKIQEVVDSYYSEFNKLTDDQKALLSGDFGAITEDSIDTSNINDEKIKKSVEDQRILYEKSLRSARDELQRLTGTWSTNFNFFNLDKETALKLTEKTSSMGSSAAKAYYEAWDKIKKENKDLAEDLLDFDVTDFTSLTNLTDYMREQGLDESLANEYWHAMVNGAADFTITYGQIATWSEGIRENMKGTVEMIDRLESGKLSAEDLTAFENAGLDTSNRMLTPDGYKVFGIDSQEARRALNQKNAEKTQADLDTLNKLGGGIENLSARDQREVDHYAEILNLTKQKDETEEEFVKRIQEEWLRAKQIAEETNDYAQAAVYTADQQAMRGGTDEQVRASVMQEASDANLDINELIAYSEKLQQLPEVSQAAADRIALDNMKMNASVKELSSNWENWNKALSGDEYTEEYSSALKSLRQNMKQMLGVSSDLSEEFLTDAENMDLMAKAAEGDGEAIDELRKKAATDIIIHAGLNLDKEGFDELDGYLNELTSEDYKIGAVLDNSQALDAIYDMLVAAGATADDIQDYFESIGWEPEFETEEYTLSEADVQRGSVQIPTLIDPFEGLYSWRTIPLEMGMSAGSTIQIPKMRGKDSHVKATHKGSAKSTVNPSNVSKGKGKGGGGGSSKSDKKNDWKNPYDKYYNLTEKINEALRTREKIERDYDRILKRRERSVSEILKNSQAEIDNLKQEIQYQKQLQAGRRDQLKNVANEKYDDDGTLRSFKDMGVTKYATYNFDEQRIEIDWEAIDKVRDERIGKAIEEYVSRLEELQDQYEETQTTIEEMEDNIWEINQRGKQEYLDLEQRVIDALINEQQKIIDDLSAKFEGINEANDKILNSMQEQIDLERQIRDNTKTEDDIAQKEARLAYLRRDTSGANTTEIMKLEQDLADARQNYTDTLIDQGLQKLSDENAKAAEQRQLQIDVMQAQLNHQVQNGEFNKHALFLLKNAFTKDGNLDINSDLVTLLKGEDNFAALTEFGKENWWTQLHEAIAAGLEGYQNFSKDKYNSKDNTLSVNGKNGQANIYWDKNKNAWVDAKGNTYEGINALTGTYESMTAVSTPSNNNNNNNGSNTNSSNNTETYPYGKASETTGNIGQNSKDTKGVKAIQYALQKLGYDIGSSGVDGKFGPKTKAAVQKFQKDMGLKQDGIVGKDTRAKFKTKGYATGGLADFTGPAWLDGTKAHPELVLNARDTENFLQLKDILSGMGSLDKLQNGGDNYYNFDIKVDQLASDYDVDKLIGKIKNEIDKDARYRNVNSINFIR